MSEAATQGWSTRALDCQINTLYYERLLATADRSAVLEEAKVTIGSLQTPRAFVRDPVMLEFLGLPGVGPPSRSGSGTGAPGQSSGFLLNSAVASRSLAGNTGSVPSQGTSTSTSSFTTSF